MAEERTLILVKPDGVEAGHIGEVITRLERRQYTISALKVIQATPELLAQHYAPHVGKPYYPAMQSYMMEKPLVAIIASGDDVVAQFRRMAGNTKPDEAPIGTIRGDFARSWGSGPIRNVVHSSDSEESADREMRIWFPELF
ncbi:nucleoside-diphosphate kinase [Lacticaseibacillus pantheris]|uniref:nucleoside-diphosphate kinase n=1 Tax=Lacticaseibacillus pantheris TaxID=171523 RepID=UPI0026581BAD|nr:nucleoside-diphosphate kinase [Lacticaseibacillus pantheris]WKF85094.1 nucleoside-diphosphate kinase [Lacticaseibacillus pantheris]